METAINLNFKVNNHNNNIEEKKIEETIKEVEPKKLFCQFHFDENTIVEQPKNIDIKDNKSENNFWFDWFLFSDETTKNNCENKEMTFYKKIKYYIFWIICFIVMSMINIIVFIIWLIRFIIITIFEILLNF
ncbi:MAG: hypothetical protein EBV03_12860, partial [Proteobacteria bacterium]|nr:hypothetical protein [Pseudomonadota bacterium]